MVRPKVGYKPPKTARVSLLTKDVLKAMKKENDATIVLTGKAIYTVARNYNFVFSPASINTVITMTTPGSDERNALFKEIATLLFSDSSSSGGPKISSINGVWVEQSLPVDHSLKDIMENVFRATFTQVDFRSKGEQVLKELNKWASDHTNGLITDLLPPGSVTSLTDKIYGNALYFKGEWKYKFDKSLTKDKEFHLVDGRQVHVPFMTSYENNKKQKVEAYNGFKVLRLPYRRGDNDTSRRKFSMCFYLPDEKDGLDHLVEEMASTPGFLDDHIPSCKVVVGEFWIPKFKIFFMFETSDLVSVSMYHEACIEIDEEGADAAAATFRISTGGALQNQKIDFVADHPFLFLIREDETGTVLFAGQILDPSQ